MGLEEFLHKALEPVAGQRAGQAFMNAAFALHPHLYKDLLASGLDAFYDDDKLWGAVGWITRNAHNYFAVQSSPAAR